MVAFFLLWAAFSTLMIYLGASVLPAIGMGFVVTMIVAASNSGGVTYK